MKHLSADVLVIGSGGAGLRAALQAARHGARVLLLTKSTVGRANCTAVAMGTLRVSRENQDIEHHFQETLKAGKFLNNPDLVRTLVCEAWPSVAELKTFGVNLLVESGKVSIAAERRPAGILLTKALTAAAFNAGVTVLEKTMVIDLPVAERCLGALALRNTGELLTISAKATILATGGYSQLYMRNDNPPPVTGDGLILAFRAGAELQDTEFVQFLPLFTDAGVPRKPIVDWLIEGTKHLVPGGPLINNKGERFLQSYNLLEEPILRDNLIVAIEQESKEDDFVILDLTLPSSDQIEGALNLEFQKSAIRPFLKVLSTKPLHIASFAHFTMGGVSIDETCSTAVEGLYAAGEVAGGIHGANRLGGNALTEILVFGTIAGNHAATYASQTALREIDKEHVKKAEKRLQELKKTKKTPIDPLLIEKDVKSIMLQFCRPIRSGEGLTRAQEELHTIEEKTASMAGNNPDQIKTALEAEFMVTLANLLITAASSRKESRGPHFRVDYPERDDHNWLKNIVLSQKDGKLNIQYAPATR